MQPSHVGSKWKKTAALLKFEHLRGYVPKTVIMTESSLKQMLDEYKMVYVKPDVGTYGLGVMRVEALADGGYRYQLDLNAKTFADYHTMYRDIVKATRGRKYLVQKGIHLLQYKGRRFDIRVMVQHNLQRQWETTALIGRVSAPKKVVTNYHNGGTPKPVEMLIEPHLSASSKRQFIRELHGMGVQVARGLGKSYPGIREIGIDVGVDREFKPWILEVNTFPDPYIFRNLPDKSVVRKVIRYAIAYGRIKPRKRIVQPAKGTSQTGSVIPADRAKDAKSFHSGSRAKRAETVSKPAAAGETNAKGANTQRPATPNSTKKAAGERTPQTGRPSSTEKPNNMKTTDSFDKTTAKGAKSFDKTAPNNPQSSDRTTANNAKSSDKTTANSPQSSDKPVPDSLQTASKRNPQKSKSQPAQGAKSRSQPAQGAKSKSHSARAKVAKK